MRVLILVPVLFSLLMFSPSLKVLAQSPSTFPADTPQAGNDSLYSRIFSIWAAGDQARAEHLLDASLRLEPQNLRLRFFRVACNRSRFAIASSLPMFRAIAASAPQTPEGRCAAIMANIDSKSDVQAQFLALERLVEENPTDALIVWMAAVQCRSLDKNAEGVKHYERLSTMVNPGPSLMHQTYANLLDELKRYDEALVHRNLAVKLEPASWSYHGMGNTLNSMGRYEEAGVAYAKALTLNPNNPEYLWNWATALYGEKKFEAAIEKCKEASEINPMMAKVWNTRGLCAAALGRWDEAMDSYGRARRIDPQFHYAYRNAARLWRYLEQEDAAQKIISEWKAANNNAPLDLD